MDKKIKENIKRAVSSGLKLMKTNLKISTPSSKLDLALKKHSKKLIEDFKKEVKRKSKKEAKGAKKSKVVKKSKAAKSTSTKVLK